MLPCKVKGCGCVSYHYVPRNGSQPVRCTCKHFSDDHSTKQPYKCKTSECRTLYLSLLDDNLMSTSWFILCHMGTSKYRQGSCLFWTDVIALIFKEQNQFFFILVIKSLLTAYILMHLKENFC